jgi:hypothetical protein
VPGEDAGHGARDARGPQASEVLEGALAFPHGYHASLPLHLTPPNLCAKMIALVPGKLLFDKLNGRGQWSDVSGLCAPRGDGPAVGRGMG